MAIRVLLGSSTLSVPLAYRSQQRVDADYRPAGNIWHAIYQKFSALTRAICERSRQRLPRPQRPSRSGPEPNTGRDRRPEPF